MAKWSRWMKRAGRRSNCSRDWRWRAAKRPICFYVFDLLQLNGRSLLGLPLTARKELLAQLCEGVGDPIRYSGEIGGEAEAFAAPKCNAAAWRD